MHVHLSTRNMYINILESIQILTWHPYLFSIQHSHVYSSLNYLLETFILHKHAYMSMHIDTNNLDNIPSILQLHVLVTFPRNSL